MPLGKTSKRLIALLVSTALSVAVAEVFVRYWMPASYTLVSLATADGREAPLAESWHYLNHYTERDREPKDGPRGRLPSDMRQWVRYDRPGWEYFDEHDCVPLTTNSLGFHDLEFPVHKPAGEFRVLASGDSFTYGLGVPLELCWVQLLEATLRTTMGQAEVINAGWSNTSPADNLEWFQSDGLRFEPDLVIVALCLNDMGPVQMLGYAQAKPERPWLGGVSAILNHIQREIEQRALMRNPPDQALLVEKDPSAWEATKAAILAMREATEAHGAQFVLVVLPMMSLLDERYPYLRLHEWVATFAKDNDVRSFDLLEVFRGMDERDLWVHPTDQHPNHVGHRLIADSVHAFLVREGLCR